MFDIKEHAEVQKLLPAIQKPSGANHHAFLRDLMTPKQPSNSAGTSPTSDNMPVCIFSNDSSKATRAAVKGEVICKHSCEHHPEVVDPRLWRKLPQELVELVFAKLPLPQIIQLCESSKAWLTMTKSANFGEACSRRYPQLFGLLGWNPHGKEMWTIMYDIESNEAKEWVYVETIYWFLWK